MTPKQPDRFERITREALATSCPTKDELIRRITKLLRREHQWVEKTIKWHFKHSVDKANEDYQNGYFDACQVILNQLGQRRK